MYPYSWLEANWPLAGLTAGIKPEPMIPTLPFESVYEVVPLVVSNLTLEAKYSTEAVAKEPTDNCSE